MNIEKLIAGCRAERERVMCAIVSLEKLLEYGQFQKPRRGRKSMGAEERLEVSRRMRRYWASRRQAKLGRKTNEAEKPN